MKLFVVCTLVIVAYTLPLDGKGVATKNVSALDLRIVNGHEAKIGQFPWQAFLIIFFGSAYGTCGGSLIRSQWVLTTGHCLKHPELTREHYTATHITILLGTIYGANGSEEVSRNSSEYYIHEGYNDTTHHNDIALVKLNEGVADTENVRAITLGKQLFPESNVQVSGFGRIQDSPVGESPRLYYADLKTIKNFHCKKETGYLMPDNEACAKSVNGSVCPGDSGGPLVMQDNGVWKQFGVTFGTLYRGCHLGTSVYLRISHYTKWILDNIQLHA